MTMDELKAACGDGTGNVLLHLDRLPTGGGIRLTPRSGPVGMVICCPTRGGTTAHFNAAAVLRWIERQSALNSPEPGR